MATAPKHEGRKGLFATKPIDVLVKDTEDKDTQLKRAVGALDLTALGLGAIIGTGIFVIIGEAITTSGPSIVLSFMLAGITCVFSALAFAELASAIPVSGSAYTYSYATLGELAAWIIGWDLILEYGVSIAGVAIGWGAYLNELLDSVFGYELPKSIANPPGEDGGEFNLPAMFLVLAVSAVLMVGVRESARTNTIMVFFKLAVLALFLVLGVTAFNADNFSPFFVEGEGVGGTVTAATLIFFAYIGFDAVSTSSEEVKEPKRDLPIAIIGSLGIATTLYILVAVVATGALPFDELKGQDAPLATALSEGAGFDWAANIISLGALVAITSVVLTLLYGQSRILFAMSRDGLMPKRVGQGQPEDAHARLHHRRLRRRLRGPRRARAAGGDRQARQHRHAVRVHRRQHRRDHPAATRTRTWSAATACRSCRVFPIIGILLCVYLARDLELETWLRFFGWMGIGLLIYFVYGYRHSRLRQGEVVNPEAELPDVVSARAAAGTQCDGSRPRRGSHVPVRRRRCAHGARVLHAAARRGGRRAVDLQPARRPPLRDLRAARLRGRHRGGPLPGHGLPHPRRDGRRLDAADQARRRHLVRGRQATGSARPRASRAATATCACACPAAAG